MCPSYMVTKDEADSTSGSSQHVAARADQWIRNKFRGCIRIEKRNPLANEDLKQVMDLCLSCKGCKNEMPVNVDVGKLKAEFLQAYHDANGVPRRSKMIAKFAGNMRWLSMAPWLFNGLTNNF